MDRYYARYNASARSYSVIDRERRNEFGDPYVLYPLVSEAEARSLTERLNRGDGTTASGRLRLTPRRFYGDPTATSELEELPF